MQQPDFELGLAVQDKLNSTIRPLLAIDAGDIEISSVEDGHVTLTLLGSCSRCLFRASCASYTVIDRLERDFEGGSARFTVTGHSLPSERVRLLPEAERGERGPAHVH